MTLTEACDVIVDQTRALAVARAERDAYRLVLAQALQLLHANGVELERVRATHERLVVEYRELRVHLLREAAA